MLNPSTVSICRKYLTHEVKELTHTIQLLGQQRASIYGRQPTFKEQERFARVSKRLKELKKRRKKVEAAIKDLKACVWTGNHKELPQCKSVSIKSSPDFSRAWPFPPLPK